VSGDLRGRYLALGGENGSLGYPVTDTFCGLVDGGCYQQFQGGALYDSASTDPSVVRGAIATRWARSGFETGALGYPLADEVCGLAGGGCVQVFQDGIVTWSPATGAHRLTALLTDAWITEDAEDGALGYPTAEPWIDPDGTEHATFQHGRIDALDPEDGTPATYTVTLF